MVIQTDYFPGEAKWLLTRHDTEVCETVEDCIDVLTNQANSPDYSFPNRRYIHHYCIPQVSLNRGYTFTIYDTVGDGLCCLYGAGYFSVYLELDFIFYANNEGYQLLHAYSAKEVPFSGARLDVHFGWNNVVIGDDD